MALSNWDTFAMDESGLPSSGIFTSPMGIRVEFYKNWLYVHDAKAWRDGGAFVEDTIMSVREGSLRYLDVNIWAVRGPKNGVYAVVWTGWEHDQTLEGMVGIGCYGFDDNSSHAFWLGVQEPEVEHLRRVVQDTRASEGDVPEAFCKLEYSKGVRFNQGDKYFADKIGAVTPRTTPGDAATPLIMEVMGAARPAKKRSRSK